MKKIIASLLLLLSLVALSACSTEDGVEQTGVQDGTYEIESNGSSFIVTLENGEITSASKVGKYVDGVHNVTGQGKFGDVVFDVSVMNGEITKIETTSHNETESLYLNAIVLVEDIIAQNGYEGLDAVSGSTYTSNALFQAVHSLPKTDGSVLEFVSVASADEVVEFDLEWSVQPDLGLVEGIYYYDEELFRQGHLGSLFVVRDDLGDILLVEFNETGRDNYYTRFYQDVPKRMSEYNFTMGARKGAAWIQSTRLMEELMEEQNKLTFALNPDYDSSLANKYDQPNRLQFLGIDVVAGASNSIQQSMVLLADRISTVVEEDSGLYFYQYAEQLEGNSAGITSLLRFVVNTEGDIVDFYYDEIFADSPAEIADAGLKEFYRQSKYQSVMYEEPARIGFNTSFDMMKEHLLAGGSMFDIEDMPATGDTGSYALTGFTKRNTAWDNYLRLAHILHEEMVADGKIVAHVDPTA